MKRFAVCLLLLVWAAFCLAQIGQQGARYAQDGLEYYERGDYANAIKQFLAADRAASGKVPQYQYWLGRLYIAVADTASARERFELYTTSGDKEYLPQVEAYQRIVRRQPEIFERVSLRSLPDYLNSRNSDYGAVPDPAGKYLYFTSLRPADKDKENIWRAEILRSGLGRPELVAGLATDKNEAFGSFALDGSGAWIFGNYEANKRDGDIYWVPRTAAGWGKPENARVFNSNQVETQPCVFRDRLMFFASSREGGYGGMDLYVSEKFGGEWSAPRNLGPTVNTPGNEQTPFLDQDGRTLYFASNGHPGFGGYDVFKVYRVWYGWQDWSLPENLGLPVNSTRDDRYFLHNAGSNEAFLSSDRELPGYENIYQLSFTPASPVTYLELDDQGAIVSVPVQAPVFVAPVKQVTVDDVLAKLDRSLEVVKYGLEATTVPEIAVSGAQSTVQPVTSRNLRMNGTVQDNSGNPVSVEVEITCLADGMRTRDLVTSTPQGAYAAVMPRASVYTVVVNAAGYMFYRREVVPPTEGEEFEFGIMLVRIDKNNPPQFADIVFAPGSAELAADPLLEEVLLTLLANPGLRLRLNGHADDAASRSANQSLGEKRARSVADYLIGKGIPRKRLDWRSQGSKQTPAGAEPGANRRVSFEVLK